MLRVTRRKFALDMNPKILTRNTKFEAKTFLDHLQFIGSMDRRLSVWPSSSLPGQKSIRLAKKGGGPSFPNAGFWPCCRAIPFPPRLFAERK
ncbi:MAG: hypothetical protein A2Z51_05635 [Deltaproteobacteria bacterium RBG_19FT_COMBO_52_11]|nr:MAG: hypothetical protein A2Z51_05635 [Deltaproteobacteria bacterium RBG_19FT_COMBO_52_11]